MDHGPLVEKEADAGAELVRELDKVYPVKAAFWLKASDEEQRHLYIASESIDGATIVAAYREVLRLAKTLKSDGLDPFRVKLIGAQNPLAEAAMEINNRFPGTMATRLGGTTFGGISVDDVYIYPPALTSTAP